MTYQPQDTQKAIKAIKVGESKEGWGRASFITVLDVAKARKEKRFNEVSIGAQLRYTGRQRAIIDEALKTQFPGTVDEKNNTTLMPIAGINIAKMLARLDAGVLVSPPDLFLEDKEGKRRADDDEAAKLWAWGLRKSRFHVKMAEAERRALITPGCSIGVATYRFGPNDKIGKPHIDLYFPHDVEVLCHWQAPTSWEHRFVVAIRQAPPDMASKGEWYLVFYRMPPDDLDGDWGKWRQVLISTEGEVAGPPEDVRGELCPVFLVQLSDPEGHAFVLEDPDLLDVIDDLQVRRSNLMYVANLQGHDLLWTNDAGEAKNMHSGPDAVLAVENGATVGLLSPNPKIPALLSSIEQAFRELAISRGNTPHAYVQKASGNPPTGIAMKIENMVHDTRVAEQASIIQAIVEDEVLPILLDVMAAHHPKRGLLKGLVPRMVPRMQGALEDPSQKQQRLLQAVDKKLIRRERAAADLDYYPSVEVAKTEINAIETAEKNPATQPTPLSLPRADGTSTPPPSPTESDKPTAQPPTAPPTKKPFPPKPDNDDAEKQTEKKGADDARTVTLNELTLGIERMGKLGDIVTLNILRKALAQTLDVPYEGDLDASDLEKATEP